MDLWIQEVFHCQSLFRISRFDSPNIVQSFKYLKVLVFFTVNRQQILVCCRPVDQMQPLIRKKIIQINYFLIQFGWVDGILEQ